MSLHVATRRYPRRQSLEAGMNTELQDVPLDNLHPTPSSSVPLLRTTSPGGPVDPISERETQFVHTQPRWQPVTHESEVFGSVKKLRAKVTFLLLTTAFTALLCYYFFSLLVAQYPKVGALNFSPSDINFIVSVLSQTYAQIIQALYTDIFDVFRWLQASTAEGVFMPTFLQLGASTGWLGSLSLLFQRGTHHLWTLQRLALPLLGIYLGSILKYHATFVWEFIPTDPTVPAFAGLAQLDPIVLEYIPTSVMVIYYTAWISSLLGVPQYVVGLPSPANCTDSSCATFFLPGGLEIARKFGSDMNSTLLQGGLFDNAEAVRLINAPGTGMTFWTPPDTFGFDLDDDCKIYGPILGDAIQFCLTQGEVDVTIGWTICPTYNYNNGVNGTCASNLTWAETVNQQTSFSLYRQNTTTVYDRQNFSIVSVDPTSESQSYMVNTTSYWAIWDKLFNPTSDTNGLVMVQSFVYQLGWYLRLYQDYFDDDQQTPTNLLRNFIAIPIQFYTTALQFSNATIQAEFPNSGFLPIPSELATIASSAKIVARFKGKEWTWISFTAIASFLTLRAVFLVFSFLFQMPPTIIPSAFPEMNSIGLTQCNASERIVTLSDFARVNSLATASTWKIVKAMRNKKGNLIEVECLEHGTHLVFVLSPNRGGDSQ